MDEDERWEYGTFATAEEAIAACRLLVDRSLMEQHAPGMSAARLIKQYIFFGDDPFVISREGGEKVSFSARDYARQRAEVICADSLSSPPEIAS
jgi:hypothetical protein